MHGSPPTQGVVEDDGGSFFTIFRRPKSDEATRKRRIIGRARVSQWIVSLPPKEVIPVRFRTWVLERSARGAFFYLQFVCRSFVVYRASFIVYSKSMMPSTPSTVTQATTATPTRPRPRSDAMTAATSAHAPEITLFVE